MKVLLEKAHAAPSYEIAGALRGAGAIRIIAFPDSPFIGPCARTVLLHVRKRRKFTADFLGDSQSDLYGGVLAAMRSSARSDLVIWSTSSFRDRIFALFGSIIASHLKSPQVFEVQLGGESELEATDPEVLKRKAAGAYRIADRALISMTRCWEAFCDGPVAVHRIADRNRLARTYLRGYDQFLPRIDRRRVLLSRIDDAILRGLDSERWSTVLDVARQTSPRSSYAKQVGLRFVSWRLRTWAGFTRGHFVERHADAPGGIYRLTPQGARLLTAGIRKDDRIPPLWIGGYQDRGTGRRWALKGGETSWTPVLAEPE